MPDSEVIAFQFEFDCGNRDEERALGILEEWQSTGLTIRQVFTLALLQLEQTQPLMAQPEDGGLGLSIDEVREAVVEVHSKTDATLEEIMERLNVMQQALRKLESAPTTLPEVSPEDLEPEDTPLPEVSMDLVASLKKSTAPGIRLEDD